MLFSEINRFGRRQTEAIFYPYKLVALVLFLSMTIGCASTESETAVSNATHDTKLENKAREEKALAATLSAKDKDSAADHYLHALEIAPQIFSYKEHIAIAKLLVAIKRRDEAITLLENVIKKPHHGVGAELLLAKILSSDEENSNVRTAKFYLHAIQLAPKKFNYDEKITIAKTLIKLKQKRDAMRLLQDMVTEPHLGTTAELMLAKLRVSTGEFDAALYEADEILHRDEKNTGALLIKGGALRRRKAFGDAIKAYRAILAKKDDFDARLGLAYCLLAIGQKQEAERQFKLLHPQYEWQRSDYEELARNIKVNVRPGVEYAYTKFSDSDNYTGVEQDLNARANFFDWDFSFSARHRITTGDGNIGIADTGILYIGTNLSESLRVLAGVGQTDISFGQDPAPLSKKKPFTIGEFRMDAQVWRGSAQISYSSQVLSSNVNLIKNEVVMNRSQLVVNQPISKSLSVKGTYRYSEYSDENLSNDYQGMVLLALNSGPPQFSIGYSYRYLNFRQQSTQGYFDPQDYVSNTGLLLVGYERGSFYLYADYYAGQQVYSHRYLYNKDAINHFGITMGMTFWGGIRMDVGMAKNNSNATGYDYYYGDSSVNWRMSYSF